MLFQMKMLFKSKQKQKKITNIARMAGEQSGKRSDDEEGKRALERREKKNERIVNEIIKILVMNMNPYLTVFYTHENIYEVFTILSGSAVEIVIVARFRGTFFFSSFSLSLSFSFKSSFRLRYYKNCILPSIFILLFFFFTLIDLNVGVIMFDLALK